MAGLAVARIGLGCGNFGGIGSAPQFFGRGLTEDQAFELMDAAWASGITHFDTADAYGGGRSEQAIGRWIRSRGVRPRLTTKTFNPMRADADRGPAPDRIARQLRAARGIPGGPPGGRGGRPDRRLRGQQLRRAATGGRPRGRGAAGYPEQLLAARAAGRAGTPAAVRPARRRRPGLQPAGRLADDAAAAAVCRVRLRPDLRGAGPAADHRDRPRHPVTRQERDMIDEAVAAGKDT
jgi:Aldo/keto reductase family